MNEQGGIYDDLIISKRRIEKWSWPSDITQNTIYSLEKKILIKKINMYPWVNLVGVCRENSDI
jgi:hypothetical protein